MTAARNQNQRWLIAAIALVAFGALMFMLGRATAPATVATENAIAVTTPASQRDASTGADNETSEGNMNDGVAAASTVLDESVSNTVVEDLPPGCEAVDYSTIALSELPPEAVDTLALIADGPPYPFDQDGGVFQNREGYLPDQPRGYYHEYTVVTPNSIDRGARRIVTGDCGELFYTSDHYDSFDLIDVNR